MVINYVLLLLLRVVSKQSPFVAIFPDQDDARPRTQLSDGLLVGQECYVHIVISGGEESYNSIHFHGKILDAK